jgi:uncharacterized membrane protein YuzA (DUF378 family)
MIRFAKLLAFLLVILGALNWGLWGLLKFDIVAWAFHGNTSPASRIIYVIIGLAGVIVLSRLPHVVKLISHWYGNKDHQTCLACGSTGCSGKSLNPIIRLIVYLLVVIGALNWGLWGLFQFDVVAWLFHGNTAFISRIIYGIIGVAGIMNLLGLGCTYRAISK